MNADISNGSDRGPLTLRDVSPDLAAAEDKLSELRAALAKVQARERRVAEQVEREAPRVDVPVTNWGMLLSAEEEAEEQEMRKLLGPAFKPEDFHGPKTVSRADARQHPLHAEAAAINVELGRLFRAIQLITDHVDGLRRKAAPELCRRRLQEYRRIAQRYCAALVELGSAQQEHQRFVRSLGPDYVNYGYLGPVMMLDQTDSPQDPESPLRRILAAAAEDGHFDLAGLPADWTAAR